MPDICQVLGCRADMKYRKGYALFSIPSDPDLREKWLAFLGYDKDAVVVKSAKICSHHFEGKYIKNNQKRTRLTRSAVPSLHPPEAYSNGRGRCVGNEFGVGVGVAATVPSNGSVLNHVIEFVACASSDGNDFMLSSEVFDEKPLINCFKSELSHDPLCV